MIGGYASNALVDFTGGIAESIDMNLSPLLPNVDITKLFDIMKLAMDKSSMLVCDIYVIHVYNVINTSLASPQNQNEPLHFYVTTLLPNVDQL